MDDIIGLLHSKLSLSAEDGASSNSPSRENKKKRSPPNDQRKESVSKPLAPCTGFPSAFLNNCGTMSIFLEPNVAVDISVNRVIRVSCVGKFSVCFFTLILWLIATLLLFQATISNDYNVSLSHELASIHQTDGCIFAAFRAGNVEKEVGYFLKFLMRCQKYIFNINYIGVCLGNDRRCWYCSFNGYFGKILCSF